MEIPGFPSQRGTMLFGFLLARCVLSILIIVGSCVTIAAVCKYKRLRKSPNFVILSLTVADLIGALLNPGVLALHYLRPYQIWRTVCLVEETLDLIASAGSVLSIVLIALDRYIHVVNYLNYQYIVTKKRLSLALFCIWFYICLAAAFVTTFGSELQDHHERCSWTLFTMKNVYYYVIIPHVAIASIFMVSLYCRIAYFVYKQRCEMLHHRKGAGKSLASAWSNSRTNSMIAIVVCSFFVATLPALVISAFVDDSSPLYLFIAQQAAILLWYCIAAANPLIYVWRNPDFRWAFSRMFGKSNEEVQETEISSTRMTAATVTSNQRQ